jgi:hypothetical protein
MFENGDSVRIAGSDQEIFTIVGTGPGKFYTVQLGNDAATRKPVEEGNLELVAKAAMPDAGPRFVPNRSIME